MNFFRAISNILRFDRTNWKALVLCFFAAAIFWIFNALNKDYATNLILPLQVEFDESQYIAVEPLPTHLLLNVSGNGWEILRKRLGFKVPVISLPLERPSETHRVAAGSLIPMVASQMEVLKLNFMVTDTLRISIEPKLSRKVKLVVKTDRIVFKNNFGRISQITLSPDSIILEGPQSIVEDIGDTIILHPEATRVSGNFRENIEVIVQHSELIKRNPPTAEVAFEVGMIDSMIVHANVIILKGSGPVELYKDSVECIFRVPQRERDSFMQAAAGLTATISVKDLKKGGVKSFLPTLNKNFSENIELVQIDSVKVKKS